ncbi:MAG: hypothetical protein HKP26_07065 [Nitrosopumilus sp.]|nr:hypothetical protein [Nitrosopumilus sp.]
MEKHTIIVLVSITIIIATFGYSLLNVFALEQIELGGIDNLFRFFEMSTDDKILVCNNTPLPANFNQLDIIIYYERELLGTFIIDSVNLMPYSVLEVDGKYNSESIAQSQMLYMHFDHLFSGSDNTVRIDPRKMDVVTEFHTTILGIPYKVSEQYTSFDFWNMLNDESNLKC